MTKEPRNVPSPPPRSDVDVFLRKLATAPPPARTGERGRLIFALDATASRESTWDRACRIQGEMFEATATLGGLDVQMVYYRGFGEFDATGWVANSRDLVREMTAVSCLGGETQIQKVLRHALAETKRRKVNAVVFVGDCCEEDVDRLGRLAGELGLLNVPLFLFQEGNDPVANRAFSHMARLTNGAHCRLDGASAAQLRELLAAVAVYAAGGRRALEDFSRKSGRDVALLTRQIR